MRVMIPLDPCVDNDVGSLRPVVPGKLHTASGRVSPVSLSLFMTNTLYLRNGSRNTV